MKGRDYGIDAHEIDVRLDDVLKETPVKTGCGERLYVKAKRMYHEAKKVFEHDEGPKRNDYNATVGPIIGLAIASGGHPSLGLAVIVVTYGLGVLVGAKWSNEMVLSSLL